MSNFAAAIKAEISRLAKKETKSQVVPLRSAVASHRRQIAALKREIAALRRQLTQTAKGRSAPKLPVPEDERTVRFQARGLITERKRLGLSQKDYGRLIGVSSQTILSWEQKKSSPRRAQRVALASIRGIGKREAVARLGT